MKAAPNPIVEARGGFICIDDRSESAAQIIRALDVLVIGPAMLYVASEVKNPILGAVLCLSGAGSIYYNARNWLLVENARRDGKQKEEGRMYAY